MINILELKRVRSGDNQIEHMVNYMLSHNKFAVIAGTTVTGTGMGKVGISAERMGPAKRSKEWKKV